MSLLLSARAVTASPLPLIQAAEARRLGIRLDPSTHARLRKGIYVDRAAYLALKPWERYAVRVHAFVLRHPSAVLCLESAAVVHGLPLFGAPRDIHVYDPGRTASRRFGDVAVHTWDDPRDVDEVDGILVTALVDTVVDLGRVLQPAPALAVADSAVSPAQGGTASLADLRDRSSGQSTKRGRARLRWLWDHVDGAAESPGESVSRAVIEGAGFPQPELQREFRYEDCLDRVDFHFAQTRAIGESDGWQKYALDDPDAAVRRLADEKRREDRLRRNGHPFARWDLSDAWRVDPLARALRAAGIRSVRPRDVAFLATLTRRTR
ncbi:hypothetical protein L2X99_12960 [Microbacterium sp. KUDC0406]|uniref:hypothetical protein n=1 Tax=Microbacterium sp. KUDC0406 TaxID=2909588 RepID=UPI001F23D770|nr:hypothetical protein [Microbacterium sp. KUDC0406]UJP09337.1 hypothetical protein L2X99_12960 [Microbacterium sp. KUDC0406]